MKTTRPLLLVTAILLLGGAATILTAGPGADYWRNLGQPTPPAQPPVCPAGSSCCAPK